jgi:hypothetical protein
MSGADKGRQPLLTGGCQCGAVRFAVYSQPEKTGLCHCRMCQKAVAGPFAALAEVAWGEFAWTRGTPSAFRSSSRAVRDFCPACGTPLSYRKPDGAIIELLTGAFDEPARVAPTFEVGTESKLAWLAHLPSLPGKTTTENSGADTVAAIASYQHPDHDTADEWRADPRVKPEGRREIPG